MELFQRLSMQMVYRLFLKNMKHYPSKNRFELLHTIQDEFHEHKQLTDGQKIKTERTKAQMGLRHVFYYIAKNKEMLENKYHNTDNIEPFAKKK